MITAFHAYVARHLYVLTRADVRLLDNSIYGRCVIN